MLLIRFVVGTNSTSKSYDTARAIREGNILIPRLFDSANILIISQTARSDGVEYSNTELGTHDSLFLIV